jgi:hypothetical protein
MKFLLSLLTVLSMIFFSSCGGGDDHDHEGDAECCGEGGECCKSDDANSSSE